MQKQDAKTKHFEREMQDLDLTNNQKDFLRQRMQDGLEIMTKKEITQCIQDYIDFGGLPHA